MPDRGRTQRNCIRTDVGNGVRMGATALNRAKHEASSIKIDAPIEWLLIRQRLLVKSVTKVMRQITQKPKPGELFCERYFAGLAALEDGGVIPAHRCSVAWIERTFPRLARAIESHIKRSSLDSGRQQGPTPLNLDSSMAQWPAVEIAIFRPSCSGTWYQWRDDSPFNDDAAKICELEASR